MAVELTKARENSNELAKELGIRPEFIYRWGTELLAKKEGSSLVMVNRNIRRKKQSVSQYKRKHY